jgi:V8-like Glu-specific endopeptidase
VLAPPESGEETAERTAWYELAAPMAFAAEAPGEPARLPGQSSTGALSWAAERSYLDAPEEPEDWLPDTHAFVAADPGADTERFATGPPMAEREVIPPDERVRIHDTTRVPFRWVCSLDVMRGGVLSRGSGLLIGPRHVLTAAHNIYDRNGSRPDSVQVAPARNLSDLPFGRFPAVAFTTSSRFLERPSAGSRFDIALVTLASDASAATSKALGGRPLGHWGSATNGHQTDLQPLDPAFVGGRAITVGGYPGDRCDGGPCDPARGWTREAQGNTLWSHFGPARFMRQIPGIVLHTADTFKGQSGSPVWMRFTSGRRSLVGVHVNSTLIPNPTGTGTITVNRAVHLSPDVLALIRSWMGG